MKNAPGKTWPYIVSILIFIPVLMTPGQAALAQDFKWAPDFPVGASIPEISAPDQNGKIRTFDSLKGEKGLVLVFNRSFDWCPYCKAQLRSLGEVSGDFNALGLEVATLTYDPVETLKLVEEDFGIDFPLLHDEDIKHVNAFGIRNLDYEPGDFAYGIPYPGIMLIDSQGVIRYKFAEENFRERPDWSDVLNAAAKM